MQRVLKNKTWKFLAIRILNFVTEVMILEERLLLMKTVNCEQCKSVMGLIKETPRWVLYQCFSCRCVKGILNRKLKPHEREEAEREMDMYGESLINATIRYKFGNISSKELNDWFINRDLDWLNKDKKNNCK